MLLGDQLANVLIASENQFFPTHVASHYTSIDSFTASFYPEGKETSEELVLERVSEFLGNSRNQALLQSELILAQDGLAETALEAFSIPQEEFLESLNESFSTKKSSCSETEEVHPSQDGPQSIPAPDAVTGQYHQTNIIQDDLSMHGFSTRGVFARGHGEAEAQQKVSADSATHHPVSNRAR